MCGIVGVLTADGIAESDLRHMVAAARHRGPDDCGIWSDPESGIGLGHARLSILDLSQAGHQPMRSGSGRYILTFNGEVYNHLDLRKELVAAGAPASWRGHSDTETLLTGFDHWGIDRTISRSVGMFAFGVWDAAERELTLGRDRAGEKPLYYGWQGNALLFGSELKSLRTYPGFRGEIDRGALTLLLRHNCIPAPYSIYRGIQKQRPGTLVTVSLRDRTPRERYYWDFRQVVETGQAHPFEGSAEEAVSALEQELRTAVRQQMVADVPLGAFLSGGVDSSTVVALMQAQSSRPVRTFSIGFREEGYDEARHARTVATHLGTDHTELYVSPQEAMDVIPRLPAMYCEPFADSSQIPTFLVSQLARREVTVSLSGDGGDELFAGYNRYLFGQRLWGKVSRVPRGLRVGLGHAMGRVSPAHWDLLLRPLQAVLPRRLRHATPGDRLVKGSAILGAESPGELYRQLVSHWSSPAGLVRGAQEPPTMLAEPGRRPRTDHFVRDMMALDFLTYLPDDILVKVDRAAMAVSLETRVPLLDHRVVEFAWRLPLSLLLREGTSKWILRQVLYRYVPRSLIERPKMGFGVPIDAWLRGPLRAWAEELLSERRLRVDGYLDPEPIRTKWKEHLTGGRNWQYHLWDVLMFQAWLGAQQEERSPGAMAPASQAIAAHVT